MTHVGDRTDSGHYRIYHKMSRTIWHRLDDNTRKILMGEICQLLKEEKEREDVYCLVYERVHHTSGTGKTHEAGGDVQQRQNKRTNTTDVETTQPAIGTRKKMKSHVGMEAQMDGRLYWPCNHPDCRDDNKSSSSDATPRATGNARKTVYACAHPHCFEATCSMRSWIYRTPGLIAKMCSKHGLDDPVMELLQANASGAQCKLAVEDEGTTTSRLLTVC